MSFDYRSFIKRCKGIPRMHRRLIQSTIMALAISFFSAINVQVALGATKAPIADTNEKAKLDERKGIAQVASNDEKMNLAIAKAKAELPVFLSMLDNPPVGVSEIGFKYPLAGREHIWVTNVRRQGNLLVGSLSNHPAEPGFALGDNVRVAMEQVSDWAYRDPSGRMQGHFTTRVLLDIIDTEQAESIRSHFNW